MPSLFYATTRPGRYDRRIVKQLPVRTCWRTCPWRVLLFLVTPLLRTSLKQSLCLAHRSGDAIVVMPRSLDICTPSCFERSKSKYKWPPLVSHLNTCIQYPYRQPQQRQFEETRAAELRVLNERLQAKLVEVGAAHRLAACRTLAKEKEAERCELWRCFAYRLR